MWRGTEHLLAFRLPLLSSASCVPVQAEMAAAAEKEQVGEASEAPDDSKQLRNSFNYSDRAAQTFNLGSKEKETMTEPPPTATGEGSCTQFEIYDEYVQDQRRIAHEEQLAKAKTAKNKPGAKKQEDQKVSIIDENKVKPPLFT